MKLSEKYPFAHSRYVVVRDGVFFTATPCYGMHKPCWVVRVMSDRYEDEPVPMLETDEWYPLGDFVSAQHSVQADLPIVCDNCFVRRASGDLCENCGSPNTASR